jgi:Flp pilus assembly protein TadD
MIEQAEIRVIDSPLTHGIFSADGLSGQYAQQQHQTKQIIAQLIAARQSKRSEDELLSAAAQIVPGKTGTGNSFAGLYFIGKCLSNNGSQRAVDYLHKAVRARPWSARAWLALARAKLRPRVHSNDS